MCCWVTLLRFGFFSIFWVENEKIQELNGFQRQIFYFLNWRTYSESEKEAFIEYDEVRAVIPERWWTFLFTIKFICIQKPAIRSFSSF